MSPHLLEGFVQFSRDAVGTLIKKINNKHGWVIVDEIWKMATACLHCITQFCDTDRQIG